MKNMSVTINISQRSEQKFKTISPEQTDEVSRSLLTTIGALTLENSQQLKVCQKVTIVMRGMSGGKIHQVKAYFSDQWCNKERGEICGLEIPLAQKYGSLSFLFMLLGASPSSLLFSTSSSSQSETYPGPQHYI